MPIGVVIIGRNEGQRLRDCLQSLLGGGEKKEQVVRIPVVYVDSGSSDGSVALATSKGAAVVELDISRPFSAARARNEGLGRLGQLAADVEYVQFVDADCLLVEGWLDTAEEFLRQHPEYAVAVGRLRERFPERSVYNLLCDMEWNTPLGDAMACGGVSLFRVSCFEAVGGFDPIVIAGEEPELCLRLRNKGWKVRRLDSEMALHDAAMTRFSQWWQRAVRSGYAYALGAWMHGGKPERLGVRAVFSNLFWGLVLPLLMLALAWPTFGISLGLVIAYLVLGIRVFSRMRRRGFSVGDAWLYALFCVLAKFPQLQGQFRFWWDALRAKPLRIIEYKNSAAVRA